MNTIAPFQVSGGDRPARWLISCDHATNRVPPCVGAGSLGLSAADMARHIAFDIGAAGLTRALAEALDAPAVLSDFSRLVIDPNRGEDDPTLVMKLYDGTVIPANRYADAAEVERRLAAFYRPYHAAFGALAARRADTVICAVHSFTPQFSGRPRRPWQFGVLMERDRRLGEALLAEMRSSAALAEWISAEHGEPLAVGENQPYGLLPRDALDQHGQDHGRPHLLLEIRSDLIETPGAQQLWATRLAPLLTRALARAQV
ncbi:N-formylglutamate amidohydrolase [Aquimixticola soesokkakensis]|nr:N-formylglutamate amidohydrolase [Aquimixticola soesokkakensis]